ncbi:MAG TPA: aminotransferase class V-fold PLP-dependent enzyme [Myxococcales bacterium]|nr:aminotransferase class V-fold PLP-dependent enzyme [Myxococcales bacterium]
MDKAALDAAYQAAVRYLDAVQQRPVGARLDAGSLRARLGGPLPEEGEPAAQVVERLAREADPGIVATAGPRFFGFVIGGSLPAALGADWLTSAWDQNAGLFVLSPAASVVEETVLEWLTGIFGLPAGTGMGFVTGGQMANTTCLAAARQSVLARAGWDVAARGLIGAPPISVLAGDEAHITVYGALRLLGLGDASVTKIPTDGQGRMQPDALRDALRSRRGMPLIVCAQAGNVNTGSFDPLPEITRLAREQGAWVHVDGAFGLWAAAAPSTRNLMAGAENADSWATDAHKWLNVPYDGGLAFVRDTAVHRAAMARTASYLQPTEAHRDNYEWTPEFSRRARGFTVYAALRSLGRAGLAALVERCCAHARLFAEILSAAPGVRVVNEVVLNQVLVRFDPPSGSPEEGDTWTREVIARVQREGTCWLSGTAWRGRALMRISVCNWSTTADDVRRSCAAILAAHGC